MHAMYNNRIINRNSHTSVCLDVKQSTFWGVSDMKWRNIRRESYFENIDDEDEEYVLKSIFGEDVTVTLCRYTKSGLC